MSEPLILVFDISDSNVTINIPIYDYTFYSIDWGDTTITSDNKTHTYTNPNTYIVKITTDAANFYGGLNNQLWGQQYLTKCTSFGSNNFVRLDNMFINATKLKEVPNKLPQSVSVLTGMFKNAIMFNDPNITYWDISNVTNISYMFEGATNFNQDISKWITSNIINMSNIFYNAVSFNQNIGLWDVQNVGSMGNVFYGASKFNQDISKWNTSRVIYMNNMFKDAISFNQDISSWDISYTAIYNMTVLNNMLDNCGLTPYNYDKILNGWANRNYNNVLINGLTLGANSLKYTDLQSHNKLTNNLGWTISGDIYIGDKLSLTFNITNDNVVINLPISSTSTSLTIDWNDGQPNSDISHNYTKAGIYTVNISNNNGLITSFGTSNDWNQKYLINCNSFGNIGLINLDNAFYNAINLVSVPNNLPTTVQSLSNMFNGASNFNQDIGGWDVQNVENMANMFNDATNFNQPIGNWNVQNVTNMSNMFNSASKFNQPIDNWDVQNVTDMSSMFQNATDFNQDISGWQVQNITNMSNMFNDATNFNQPIGNWNVQNVENMANMFRNATNFNQPIGNWSVQKVTNMDFMFLNATSFNKNIGNWKVQNVSSMDSMFYNASKFNQDIGNWNVQNVTNMLGMFRNASKFNQPIGKWKTSKVENMQNMFNDATNFNQNISNWNVQNVTNMIGMFLNASKFDQNIGNWNVQNVENMNGIFNNCGLKYLNYDKILLGWSKLKKLQKNVKLTAKNIFYTNVKARNILISKPNNWKISDDKRKQLRYIGESGGTKQELKQYNDFIKKILLKIKSQQK